MHTGLLFAISVTTPIEHIGWELADCRKLAASSALAVVKQLASTDPIQNVVVNIFLNEQHDGELGHSTDPSCLCPQWVWGGSRSLMHGLLLPSAQCGPLFVVAG